MDLDPQVCAQARLTRDARFDGRFFIGVRTTRIYCRPVCPVRTAKEQNVRYFATAAAAAESGYRPCLRCRPELSPGAPAWCGTSTTVARALRLISEGNIQNESLETLAARLGVGGRQLRRLFVRHLGASPLAVLKTHRLQFAKKLLDETTLSMTQIALAAGYGSVRRFNSDFRQTYQRTPTQVRRLAHQTASQSDNEYLFRLCFRPPLHWEALLRFLAQRAISGVEAVDPDSYSRLISLGDQTGTVRVSPAAGPALEVRINFPDPRWLFTIIERLRQMFDLGADPIEIGALLSTDPILASRIKRMPGLRVPGCWDGFELAVRAILGQQVSVAGASTLAGRLVRAFGTKVNCSERLTHLFPSPEALAKADIAGVGLPKARARTIRLLAEAVRDAEINFGSVVNVGEFKTRLRRISGIGTWTAEYIAMRTLNDPDAFPASDLGLLRALSLTRESDLIKRADAWRPWRSYAAMYLWQATASAPEAAPSSVFPGRSVEITLTRSGAEAR
jgi:AraC family transcriptional regulator, regulatory protein of adaptative response / DNA-3-methyladenine glycosylase II